jgi:hypothetical protein
MLGQFQLAQRGGSLEVACVAPRTSVDGVAYDGVDIEIFWGEGQVDLEKEGQRRTVRAAPGDQVVETLPLPTPGTLVRAAARATVGRSEGQRTLILALEAQPPLTPPTALTARLLEGGVALSWQGPLPDPVAPPDLGLAGPLPFSDFLSGEPTDEETRETEAGETEATRSSAASQAVGAPLKEAVGPPTGLEMVERSHGFRVYRRARSAAFGPPLNREPLESRELQDERAPVGRTACYVVRAVASVDPLIESASSNEVCIEVRDIAPPTPPIGLAVVPREGGLEVVWSPSSAPDVAGYRIYRATGSEDAMMVAEVDATATAWRDSQVDARVLYRYTITALDRAGNEGPPSDAAEGRPD